jgi:hypothetical protein
MKIELNPSGWPWENSTKRIGFFIEVGNKNVHGRFWYAQVWFFWFWLMAYGKRFEWIVTPDSKEESK